MYKCIYLFIYLYVYKFKILIIFQKNLLSTGLNEVFR